MNTHPKRKPPCLRVSVVQFFLTVFLSTAWAADTPSAEARALVQAFMKTLKGELMAGLAEGGPEQAITTCSEKAPALSAEIARTTGWRIGRTSLKPRNPDNAPDDWERKHLERFRRQKEDGADPGTLEAEAVVDGAYRYMKAIPTAALCLTCHGEQIAPSLQAKLKTLYPKDRATGYQEGDLRGAFTLQKTVVSPGPQAAP